ncbi:WAT1-related protein At1g43650-like [Andrographis paniculata]|uniref:WAT1-related protein At1g43650-like n=1 Tax=Andrographis paniculata TaxID=175694 RepID=UPI0021E87A7F|nr:WAT1-related protein At1g43650-like [Andrographis paniculata]
MVSINSSSPYLAMAVVQLAYAGSNILTKLALDRGLNQLVFVVYRHLIALVILSPLAYALERKQRPAIGASAMARIFVLSFFGVTVHLNLYYAGMNYTSPTVATALSNIIPALTIVVAALLRMEEVKLGSTSGKAKVVGAVACIAGSLIFTFWKGESVFEGSSVVTLALGRDDRHENWVKGSILIIVSFVAWSVWLILMSGAYKIYPARLSLTVLICLFGTLQSSFLSIFWARDFDLWKIGWNMQLWTVLYCGIMVSALVYYLQTWCISKKGPVFAAMFSPLLVVIVGLFSVVVFGERLHLGSLLGAVVIVSGLYCVLWGKRNDEEMKKETAAPTDISHGRDDEEKTIDNFSEHV